MPAWISNLFRLVVIVLMPLVFVLTNVRALLTPIYVNWEYNLPDFPADPYRFTTADRLKYSAVALEFLLNDAGIEFLGNQRFPEGVTAPFESQPYYETRDETYMYNDRELKHMVDVKRVVKAALNVWAIGTFLWLVAVIALAWQPETRPVLRSGLLIGAGATVGLLVALGLYVAIGFDAFFVQFHLVFFEGNSWLFLWSDTLIRLFPEKFWYDAFLWIAGGTVAEAALLAAGAWFGLKAK